MRIRYCIAAWFCFVAFMGLGLWADKAEAAPQGIISHQCIKSWWYSGTHYWHVRYYHFGVLSGVGRNHIGWYRGPVHRCWT